ncbi:MAG: metal-dependent hydrolase, partial [Candidatus Gracilibacteria bacterium]|nr:metal-dependent hydrolase [Candidatus Gracilibacteria bacterium]
GMTVSLVIGVFEPYKILNLGFAFIGALFADLDTQHETKIKHLAISITKRFKIKPFYIPAFIVGRLFKHRASIFHSIFGVLLFGGIFSGVLYLTKGIFYNQYLFAFVIGYASHLLADGITRSGLKMFYPFSHKKIRLLPKFLCIRTNTFAEILVEMLFYLIFMAGFLFFLIAGRLDLNIAF